jgi:hypothetical protein
MSNKEDFIGKRMTWDDMVECLPDLWVVIRDYGFKDGNITDGIITDILTDDEIENKPQKYRDEKYVCIRTTEI